MIFPHPCRPLQQHRTESKPSPEHHHGSSPRRLAPLHLLIVLLVFPFPASRTQVNYALDQISRIDNTPLKPSCNETFSLSFVPSRPTALVRQQTGHGMIMVARAGPIPLVPLPAVTLNPDPIHVGGELYPVLTQGPRKTSRPAPSGGPAPSGSPAPAPNPLSPPRNGGNSPGGVQPTAGPNLSTPSQGKATGSCDSPGPCIYGPDSPGIQDPGLLDPVPTGTGQEENLVTSHPTDTTSSSSSKGGSGGASTGTWIVVSIAGIVAVVLVATTVYMVRRRRRHDCEDDFVAYGGYQGSRGKRRDHVGLNSFSSTGTVPSPPPQVQREQFWNPYP